MRNEQCVYRTIRIDYVCEQGREEEAEQAVIQALCDAGNSIIGDDLDGRGTKIEIVSDCGSNGID